MKRSKKMLSKKLAYLQVKVEPCSNNFCEVYTFLKPTVLYLPKGFIIHINSIERESICLVIKNLFNPEFCQKVVLSLCECATKKIVVEIDCKKVVLCLKLCAINILKPCYKCECNDYTDDCMDICCKEDFCEDDFIC